MKTTGILINISLLFLCQSLFSQLNFDLGCQNQDDAVIGLDRKAWTANVADVSESYQIDFDIPLDAPFPCTELTRVNVSIEGFNEDLNTIPPGCFLTFWTHALPCDDHDPISCPSTEAFFDQGGLITSFSFGNVDDLPGNPLGIDIVVVVDVTNGCDQDAITSGNFEASFDICVELVYSELDIDEPLDLGDDIEICEGELTDIVAPDIYDFYEWDDPNNTETPVLEQVGPGLYQLIVTDEKGCTSSDEIVVTSGEEIEIFTNPATPISFCSDNIQTVTLSASGGYGQPYDFDWDSDAGLTGNTNMITTNTTDVFTVTVTDDNGCTKTDEFSVMIETLPDPGMDSSILLCQGESIDLVTLLSPGADTTGTWIDNYGILSGSLISNTDTSGTFIIDYFFQGNAPCPDTSSSFQLTIAPDTLTAGNDVFVVSCAGTIVNLAEEIDGDTLGIFVDDQGDTLTVLEVLVDTLATDTVTVNYIVGSPGCTPDSAAITLVLANNIITNFTDTICSGDSLLINNTFYSATNPSGTDTLVSASGCDSIINVSLEIYESYSILIADQLCSGDFIEINSTIYDESNPNGTEMLLTTQGCDSIITINLGFGDNFIDTMNIVLCEGGDTIINNTLYNASNPEGSDTISSMSGCDSILVISLSFFDPPSGALDTILCPGQSISLGGTTFNEMNQTGTVTLEGASTLGCDSIINVSVSFHMGTPGNLDTMLCFGESLIIGGVTFNEQNPIGAAVLQGASSFGCDSVIDVSVSFHMDTPANLDTMLCFGESLIIGGVTFNEQNPMGSVVLQGASNAGCDSTINVSIIFTDVSEGMVVETLCPTDSVIVNGTVYNMINSEGIETIPNGSSSGCDSVITIQLSFYSESSANIITGICENGSLTIEGEIFDMGNPSGTIVLPNASYQGCDSLIYVDLFFNPTSTGNQDMEICEGDSVLISGVWVFQPGIYVDSLFNQFGCDSLVDVNITFVDCTVQITYNSNDVTCPENSDGSLQVALSSNMPFSYSYDISLNDFVIFMGNLSSSGASVSFTNLVAGVYTVDIFNEDGNIVSSFDITISAPEPMTYQAIVDNVSCFGQDDGSIQLTLDGGNPPFMVSWDTGQDGTFIADLGPGTYNAIITDSNNCQINISESVTAAAELEAEFEFQGISCFGDQNGSIEFTNPTGGTPPYTYSIGGLFEVDPIFDNLGPGNYILVIQDDNGCLDTLSTVELGEGTMLTIDLPSFLSVEAGTTVELNPALNFSPLSISWSPMTGLSCFDCLNPTASPGATTTYTLIAEDISGCFVEASVTINVTEPEIDVFIPNVFSPGNQDGINDTFFPQFENTLPVVVTAFRIYDRWGNLIYNDISEAGWNGIYKNDFVNPGVYTFVIEYNIAGSEHREFGSVTVVR